MSNVLPREKRISALHHLVEGNTLRSTNRLTGVSPLSYTHVTPIALIAHDYMVIAVKPDSRFKTAREMFQQMAKDPNSVTGGMNNRAGAGHIAAPVQSHHSFPCLQRHRRHRDAGS